MKFKKVTALALCVAMSATALAGCGSKAATTDSQTAAPAESTAADTADTADAAEEAPVETKDVTLKVWAPQEDQNPTDTYDKGMLAAMCDAFNEAHPEWNITYEYGVCGEDVAKDEVTKDVDAAADDKIDIFLVEADYALKYVDTDYTMAVSDLGITDSDLSKQYQYTKDVVTDSNGVLKGVSWQGCPGVLFYNRDAAKAVLGSDDPSEVQNYVKDWDTFNDTAKKMKDAGYTITSSANDTYRVYSNNVTSKWVVDGKINIDDNIMKWVDDSKELVDAGETGTYELWSDDWKKGFYPEGNVFCYFGPAWLVNFSMAADTEGSIGYNGGWGATEGPQGFFWGGTWICAANGTDNQSLVKDIMLQMTTNDDVMKEIIEKDDDFVNNQDVIAEMADSSYSSKILGGQNPLGIYSSGVSKLDLSNLSAYDQGCNEEFQNAMKNYFEGTATKEEALDLFYKSVVEKYPELTY